MDDALILHLEEALGAAIIKHTPLPVGYGLKGYRLHMSDGSQLALKTGTAPIPDQLETEAFMLGKLKALSDLPIPEVIYSTPQMLVMEWIEGAGSTIAPSHQQHMAKLLARLHNVPRPCFGFERDTVIGTLPQPNPQSQKWIPFFRDHRLIFLARYAYDRGKLSAQLLKRLENLGERLGDLLDEPSHPALIHGDIWSGNVITDRTKITGLIDPAIYFAHPEIELAFMTMFGSFGDDFFSHYSALTEFDAQGFFKTRRRIYLLYPLLVHVLLCGPSYLRDIENSLDELGL